MHIIWMWIRWRKQTVYLNAFIYLFGEAGKFGPMHFFAGIFLESSFRSRHLGRAGRDADHHLIEFLLNLISNKYAPGKKPQRPDKTFEALLLNVESF